MRLRVGRHSAAQPDRRFGVPDQLAGQSIAEVNFRNRFGLVVLVIRRGAEVLTHPHREDGLRQGDQIVVAGKNDALEKLGTATAGLPAAAAKVADGVIA
ncbi:MAG: TrkA C-terminal domain-containing protein [Chloroflexi bacterium]|nr:TrkA C-terminal domain-containing protein [Chloroflexota bacterium]